ncbi:MAG TPA: tetratricopeptide repeat protein [Opitutales bacterium]|jgi:tetratricopeptide (TPR) repeat protein|nr:tetratricopeptide repeat protein [Opitutales bacterium]
MSAAKKESRGSPSSVSPSPSTGSKAKSAAPDKVAQRTSPKKIYITALLLVLAVLLAYINSLGGPFVLDDQASIANNPSIQHGWYAALFPPANGEAVTGRPLVNLTFAANFQFDQWRHYDGFSVSGYHAVNLLIHLLAGLTLFGLIRRTLLLPSLREQFAGRALDIAFIASLLWLLHPLQTESVTYLSQRAEELMSLFYLLTLYGFVRGVEGAGRLSWLFLSLTSCLLGVFCKEVIVTAPLLVFLFDRTFVAGGFAAAWRTRKNYYLALAATWLPLAGLVAQAGGRGGSAGFIAGAEPVRYLLTQTHAIIVYLQLSLWPRPLVFDYGNNLIGSVGEAAPYLLAIILLLAGTIHLLKHRPKLGFLAAGFFLVLAPSSSFVPIMTDTMAEHRMYLPLAAVMVFVTLGLSLLPERRMFLFAGAALAAVLAGQTFARNDDYKSAFTLWRDTVVKRPDVARAHENFGAELLQAHQVDAQAGEVQLGARELGDSIVEFQQAIALQSTYPEAENNLGSALAQQGQVAKAVPHFAQAAAGLRLPHEKAMAYFNLGYALGQLGRYQEAVAADTQCLALEPGFVPAQTALADAKQHSPTSP